MEPVKGGNLVNLPEDAKKVLTDLNGGSVASYAVRFAAGFEGNAYPGVKISVREAGGSKCPRCWVMTEDADPETGLCPRCRRVVAAMK